MTKCTLPVLATALALALTACGGGSDSGAPSGGNAAPDERPVKAGGELVLALAEDPDVLDPSLGRTLVGREIFINFCEKLYDVDKGL